MLSYNLHPVFKLRGISNPLGFMMNSGISRNCANKLLSSECRSMRLDHIEILCRVLVCEPYDLMEWRPEANHQYPEGHPMLKLKNNRIPAPIDRLLKTMPLDKLKELSAQLNNNG